MKAALILTHALAVAPLFVGCAADTEEKTNEAEEDLGTSLLVASLNIQEGRDAGGHASLTRQIACLRAVNADIVMLQESALPGDERAVHAGNQNNATAIANALGMRFEGTAETADTPGTGASLRLHYGVAILWKPTLHLNATNAYVPARGLRNGIQWIDVPVGGHTLHLFDGHIHTTSPRYEEANLVKAHAPDPVHTVVMGDLNGHHDQIGTVVMGAGHFRSHFYPQTAAGSAFDAVVTGANVTVTSLRKICAGTTDHPWGLAARFTVQ